MAKKAGKRHRNEDEPDEKSKEQERIPVLSYDVYHWPEFKAFAERLGFQWRLPSRGVRITMPFDGEVTIDHEYLAMEPEDGPADVTTQHNKDFRTFREKRVDVEKRLHLSKE